MYILKTYLFENLNNLEFSVTSDAMQWRKASGPIFCHRLLGNAKNPSSEPMFKCIK